MKSRKTWFISGVAAAVLATAGCQRTISGGPEGGCRSPGVAEASAIYKWLLAWSVDHDGMLPEKLVDLKIGEYGFDDNLLKRVIEYRGAGKKLFLDDLSNDFLVLRCRAGLHNERETRVYADGRIVAAAQD